MGATVRASEEFERIIRAQRGAGAPARRPSGRRPSSTSWSTAAIDDLPAEFRDAAGDDAGRGLPPRPRVPRLRPLLSATPSPATTYHDRIVIYQDTLERDFGHDPELLRAQVERTLRHEVAHHLGWGERGVRELGL